MEEELKCYVCKEYYREPVLLPCDHALCRSCAAGLQCSVAQDVATDYQEADKASMGSETDSGVVCGSRPSSYAGTPAAPIAGAAYRLMCPVCDREIDLDDNGAEGLPPYRVMQRLVERIAGVVNPEEACQMCEGEKRAASVRCVQCAVRYCAACRVAWHPARGPLALHALRPPGWECPDHQQLLTSFCLSCHLTLCDHCLPDHQAACEIQPLPSAARALKTELSQVLQTLSEKAKLLTEHVQRDQHPDGAIDEQYSEMERQINAGCAALQAAVEERRKELLRTARGLRAAEQETARARADRAAGQLAAATATLHLCAEALRDGDHAAFLQVSRMLSARAALAVRSLPATAPPETAPALPRSSALCLAPLLAAISDLNLVECTLPLAPEMVVEQCIARGCSATLCWQPGGDGGGAVSGYQLQLDDGAGGAFRDVYCGAASVCTVEGLHVSSLYSARVRAYNAAGAGPYSHVLGLQTSGVAWFSWDLRWTSAEGVSVRERTVRAAGWAPRVLLGDVPLARGVHCWALTIDHYDNDADPAFGVARADVAKDKMLGSDALGWAMYVDGTRSWFVHGGAHAARVPRGVRVGTVVTLVLDLTRGTLRFALDGDPQGAVAFSGLRGTLYPAVSLQRGVGVTLTPALTPPASLSAPALTPPASLTSDHK